jgi:filamentous hemagglutinin
VTWSDITFVPGAADAVVPPSKLRDYALDPDHHRGGAKARLFASRLGIGRDDWEFLAGQLRAGVRVYPVSRIDIGAFGASYEVVIPIDGLNGETHPVVSAWFVEAPREGLPPPPRLVSAYVQVVRRRGALGERQGDA